MTQPESSPSGGGNAEVVRRFLEAQYAADYDRAFREYACPEFIWVVGTAANEELNAAIPWAGIEQAGREGYIRLTSQLFSEFEVLAFEPRRFSEADDERVFVEGRFSFRHRVTGEVADSDFLARFDMREGRIAGGQLYENTYAIAAARR